MYVTVWTNNYEHEHAQLSLAIDPILPVTQQFSLGIFNNRAFLHDVTAAILVFQDNETSAMLVFQNSPVGVDFSYVTASFCSDKFA